MVVDLSVALGMNTEQDGVVELACFRPRAMGRGFTCHSPLNTPSDAIDRVSVVATARALFLSSSVTIAVVGFIATDATVAAVAAAAAAAVAVV